MSVMVQNSPVLVQVADDQIRVFGLGGSTPSAHVHSASDITSGTLDSSRLPTGIDAAKIGGGAISNAEFACLDGATSPLQAQLDTAAAGAAAQFSAISVSLAGKANASHTHSAADITSGTVAPARLGSGTATNSTLLDGSGAWRALAAGDVPNHSAALLTSGTLPIARLNGGNNTQFARGDGTYSNTLLGGLTLAGNIVFSSTFGVAEENVRSYANGGPNLANESLRQLRNGTIFSRSLNTGAAVQSRANSIAIPGGAAIVYSGTGSQASIYLGESFIPIDTTKTYLLRGWLANTINNTQQSYIGLLCYTAAGGILSYIYPAASAVVAPSGGQWYQGYVSGSGFPAGTQYVRTATLIGYGSPSGAWTTQTSPIEFIECPAQCGAFHNTTQSVANATWTAAAFNSEILDTSNLHDTATNTDRINVPRTGKYRITAQAEFAGNATGYRQARITVNGSALARSTKIIPNNGASLEAQAGIEIYALLTAGDIVRLEAYQDSGGALNLTSNTRLYLLWISD